MSFSLICSVFIIAFLVNIYIGVKDLLKFSGQYLSFSIFILLPCISAFILLSGIIAFGTIHPTVLAVYTCGLSSSIIARSIYYLLRTNYSYKFRSSSSNHTSKYISIKSFPVIAVWFCNILLNFLYLYISSQGYTAWDNVNRIYISLATTFSQITPYLLFITFRNLKKSSILLMLLNSFSLILAGNRVSSIPLVLFAIWTLITPFSKRRQNLSIFIFITILPALYMMLSLIGFARSGGIFAIFSISSDDILTISGPLGGLTIFLASFLDFYKASLNTILSSSTSLYTSEILPNIFSTLFSNIIPDEIFQSLNLSEFVNILGLSQGALIYSQIYMYEVGLLI